MTNAIYALQDELAGRGISIDPQTEDIQAVIALALLDIAVGMKYIHSCLDKLQQVATGEWQP